MKFSFHSLNPFLPLFCNYHFHCSQFISRQAGVSKLDSVLLKLILLYNYLAGTTQETQPLYCWEGVFAAPLYSNGIYLIVTCLFVAAGMCLPSRCLEMNILTTLFRLSGIMSQYIFKRPLGRPRSRWDLREIG
jgi:hypothetical protein